uniref:Uncharacterized protein n=1 Tax=Mustela putorius furo TaxID=9669 RepID=M3Z6C0_MUSPF
MGNRAKIGDGVQSQRRTDSSGRGRQRGRTCHCGSWAFLMPRPQIKQPHPRYAGRRKGPRPTPVPPASARCTDGQQPPATLSWLFRTQPCTARPCVSTARRTRCVSVPRRCGTPETQQHGGALGSLWTRHAPRHGHHTRAHACTHVTRKCVHICVCALVHSHVHTLVCAHPHVYSCARIAICTHTCADGCAHPHSASVLCVHLHPCASMCTHTSCAHMRVCACCAHVWSVCVRAHLQMPTHMHTPTHTFAHTHTGAHMHTDPDMWVCISVRMHTCTHSLWRIDVTHTSVSTRTHKCTHTCVHTVTGTSTVLSIIRLRVHAHSYTRVHTPTRVHPCYAHAHKRDDVQTSLLRARSKPVWDLPAGWGPVSGQDVLTRAAATLHALQVADELLGFHLVAPPVGDPRPQLCVPVHNAVLLVGQNDLLAA